MANLPWDMWEASPTIRIAEWSAVRGNKGNMAANWEAMKEKNRTWQKEEKSDEC